MKRSLLTATFILMASSGLALAQSATSGAASDTPTGFSSLDETTRDAFFTDDNMLKSSDELRAGWQALDSDKQAQIRAECSSMQASASGSTTTSGGSDSAAASTPTAPSGTSSETTASTTMGSSDSATSGSGSATGSSSSGMAAGSSSSGAAGSMDMMPSVASLEQLCDEIQSF